MLREIVRHLASIFLTVTCALGWEYEYATNRDGSVFYFSSSLRMKGTTQFFHPKIFVWEAGKGVRLFEQRASDLPARIPPQGWVGERYFSLTGADVSSDGATVSVIGVRSCIGTTITNCSTSEPFQSAIYIPGRPAIRIPGAAILSRNGRYAVSITSDNPDLRNPLSAHLTDLQGGQSNRLHGWTLYCLGGRQVADDGTVLLWTSAGCILVKGGLVTSLDRPPDRVYYGSLSADATMVVYVAERELTTYSVATRRFTQLSNEYSSRVAISDDAAIIAFDALVSQGGPNDIRQVHVVRGDGTGKRRLTNFAEGAYPVAVSGDGKVVFAITGYLSTGLHRIVRIDIASGQWTEIVPPMPGPLWVPFRSDVGTMRVSPGMLASFGVEGLTQETTESRPPLPSSLGGMEVRIGGRPAPVAAISTNAVRFQVPWDLPEGYSELEVFGPYLNSSLFAAGVLIAPEEPRFFEWMDIRSVGNRAIPGSVTTAAHEDFSKLVSFSAPARPGEAIHLYAHGLGPANPLPAPGEAASSQPLSRLASPLTCIFRPTNPSDVGVAAEILFAGLAPGMMGIYQIDVRMPATFQSITGGLNCRLGDPIEGILLTGGVPVLTTGN